MQEAPNSRVFFSQGTVNRMWRVDGLLNTLAVTICFGLGFGSTMLFGCCTHWRSQEHFRVTKLYSSS